MNNKIQFEVILTSFFFGIILMILYDFLNCFLYNKKGKLIRFLIELIFFSMMSLLFFIVLLKISNANFNIFIPIFVFLGVLTYLFTIQYFFTSLYNKLFVLFSNKLKEKKILFHTKFDIIKENFRKRKMKRNEKNQRSKGNSPT